VGDFDARTEDVFVAENMKENFRYRGEGEMALPGRIRVFICLLISSDRSLAIVPKSFRLVRIRSVVNLLPPLTRHSS